MATATRILMLVLVVGCVAAPRASVASAASAGRGSSAVAHRFAVGYLRYIDGRRKASSLPAATGAVRVAAVKGGRIPRKDRHGRVVLVSLKRAKGVRGGVLIKARIRSRTLFAEAVLTRRGGRWVVTNLLTPDFVQVFTPPHVRRLPVPRAASAPQRTARRFLRGYLAWAYGHGPLAAIHAATGGLIARLAASPPNIPPTMTGLHGRVRAIAMQRRRKGWSALVNVDNAASTYQLTLTVERFSAHSWRVTKVTTQ